MKKIWLTQSLIFALSLLLAVQCSDSDSGENSSSNGINLQETLFGPGNTVALESATGEKVNAVATDTDGDGVADGLDLNGDSSLEMIYVLDVKSAVRSADAIAFTFAGSETIYYFLILDGAIVMWTSNDADDVEAGEVTLVTEGQTVVGLNDDGGTEVTIIFEVPLYFGETPSYVAVSPADGGTIGPNTTIVVNLSESVSSVSLSGNLGTAATYVLSDNGGKEDDTLSITPDSTWPSGSDLNLVLDLVAASGETFEAITLVYDVDTTAPTLLISSPSNGGDISDTESMSYQFDEAVSLNNLVVTFGFGPYTAELSTTTTENDTLLLHPDGGMWSTGCSDPIDISIEDEFGNTGSVNHTGISIGGC